jgi:hypothetical protein
MQRNRVTLSAFGTTGVLLAASLTLLAVVSALVTFDAWPTRAGGAMAAPVAIHRAPAARVVRAVRRTQPATVTPATVSSGGGTALASAGTGAGALASAGVPTAAGGTVVTVVSGPTVPVAPPPQVPRNPAGEDFNPPSPPPPDPIHTAVCNVTAKVSVVAAEAGSFVGC